MKCSTYLQYYGRSLLLQPLDLSQATFTPSIGAADYKLAWRIIISRNYNVVYTCTNFFNNLIVKAENSGHGRGLNFAACLHCHGPFVNQLQTVFKRKGFVATSEENSRGNGPATISV
jgi:hypothetical protein